MYKFFILLAIPFCVFASPPNFAKYDGTAVIFDINTSKKEIFNTARADERLSPCSTFKILNSMISLDAGAVKDENEAIAWDGKVRDYPAWNRDHNMHSAISVSAVWFYQELARRVGAQKMRGSVNAAHYGNMDISHTLTDFWLGRGSLKITANEQVDFLVKLVKSELPFSKRAMNTTKEIMVLEKRDGYVLRGKTGSCGGVGWFVGYIEDKKNTRVFAFNIKGDGANGIEAKKIAIEYLGAHHKQ